MEDKFKTVSLDSMIDKHIGKLGTERRDAFETELRIDLLGLANIEGSIVGFFTMRSDGTP